MADLRMAFEPFCTPVAEERVHVMPPRDFTDDFTARVGCSKRMDIIDGRYNAALTAYNQAVGRTQRGIRRHAPSSG